MELIQESEFFSDPEEYAAFVGAWDAAYEKPISATKFTHKFATELRRIYELAYEFELISGILKKTSPVGGVATVLDWDDCTGWGSLSIASMRYKFCYTDSENSEDNYQPGESVLVEIINEKVRRIKKTFGA